VRAARSSLLALGALLLAACAANPPAPAPVAEVTAPRFSGGETWVYEQIDPYNGQQVRTLTDELVRAGGGFKLIERSSRERDPVETRTFPRPWAIAAENDEYRGRTYDPPFELVRFPVAPGARWRQKLEVHDSDGGTYVWYCAAHALDWEQVSTRAGSFAALRIVLQRDLGDSKPGWNDTEVYETLWYSPAARRWVRRELRTQRAEKTWPPRIERNWMVWELTAYRPAH
jgi:hypothetical protein